MNSKSAYRHKVLARKKITVIKNGAPIMVGWIHAFSSIIHSRLLRFIFSAKQSGSYANSLASSLFPEMITISPCQTFDINA